MQFLVSIHFDIENKAFIFFKCMMFPDGRDS